MNCSPKLFVVALLLLPPLGIVAQESSISEKQISLQTYPFSDPNPIPEFGKIYPYFRFEGYSVQGVEKEWKMVELENDYIKLWVTPEIGGKIWGAIEKATGKEFIYYNHAVKFRDVAMRGPWTSGGIELNFGVIGHAPTCSTPVDYLIRKNDDGSVSCFVGAIDLPSHTRWSVEINLQKDKAYFTTRSVWDNPTEQEQSYYHWMNLGVKTAGNLEYIFPGTYYLGHEGNHLPWPVDEQGRNISFYENNNFGSYKSYHVFGETTGFYGAYWHNDDFGFVHYSPYDEKPGKKVWIWGLSDQGMIWEKLLTDTDGQYTEIQSGRLFNQAAEGSSLTPFKNRGFAPGSTDQWTEHWFPVKGTQGLKNALPVGSVNLEQQGNKVSVWFCPNETVNGTLKVKRSNEVVFSKEIHSKPMQGTAESFEYKGDYKNLSVWLNRELLFDLNREKQAVKRPVDSPSGFNWETTYGHYLKGKEQERQRLYKTAGEEYQKALETDPWYVPALTGMANLAYRKFNYQASLEYSLKALSIDTYDPEANLIYGLAGLAKGDTTSAIDGFSIASAGISVRSAAYNALASIFLNQGNYSKAFDYAEKSLAYNQLGADGVQLKILCLRKLGLLKEAESQLTKLEEKDPLNHFIRIERFLSEPSSENKALVQKYITNELPHETYLEYALWYYRNGQLPDALNVLELAEKDHPVVLLWEAYMEHLSGKEQKALVTMKKAIEQSPKLVFPYRAETMKPLEWAQTLSDSWKLKYYAGLIYLNAGDEEKGRNLWNSCNDVPDFYPFYIARSRLSEPSSQQARADIERALSLGGDDWRIGLFASGFYLEQNDTLKAEKLAQSLYGKYPQNYYLGLQYAKVLELDEKYSDCVSLLQKMNVLPNEGATDGRIIWRNANIGNALNLIKAKKYSKALESIGLAKQWPENLGVGKPYGEDERLEDFISLQCYKKLKDSKSTGMIQKRIIAQSNLTTQSSGINDFLTVWTLRESGNKSKADQIMNELVVKNSSSKQVQWCTVIYSGDFNQAKTIAKNVDANDRNFLFLIRIFEEVNTF
jgi:tetratricopeptide (TPR) repeat protein